MNKAIIGLGSNINPEENIQKAAKLLAEYFHVLNQSRFIKTKPIGYVDQADFINGTVFLETDLNQEQLTASLKNIENQLGRKRSEIKFGPRTIDLDIIVFNDKIVDQDFYERDFVQKSTLELVPDLKY